jgi:hypothetical protein
VEVIYVLKFPCLEVGQLSNVPLSMSRKSHPRVDFDFPSNQYNTYNEVMPLEKGLTSIRIYDNTP